MPSPPVSSSAMWAVPAWSVASPPAASASSVGSVEWLDRRLALLERRAEEARRVRNKQQPLDWTVAPTAKRKRQQHSTRSVQRDTGAWNEHRSSRTHPLTATQQTRPHAAHYHKSVTFDDSGAPAGHSNLHPAPLPLPLTTLSAFQLDRLLLAYSNSIVRSSYTAEPLFGQSSEPSVHQAAVASLSSLDTAIAAIRHQRADEDRRARKERLVAGMIRDKTALLQQQHAILDSERRGRRDEQLRARQQADVKRTAEADAALRRQMRQEVKVEDEQWRETRKEAQWKGEERREEERYWTMRAERERLERQLAGPEHSSVPSLHSFSRTDGMDGTGDTTQRGSSSAEVISETRSGSSGPSDDKRTMQLTAPRTMHSALYSEQHARGLSEADASNQQRLSCLPQPQWQSVDPQRPVVHTPQYSSLLTAEESRALHREDVAQQADKAAHSNTTTTTTALHEAGAAPLMSQRQSTQSAPPVSQQTAHNGGTQQASGHGTTAQHSSEQSSGERQVAAEEQQREDDRSTEDSQAEEQFGAADEDSGSDAEGDDSFEKTESAGQAVQPVSQFGLPRDTSFTPLAMTALQADIDRRRHSATGQPALLSGGDQCSSSIDPLSLRSSHGSAAGGGDERIDGPVGRRQQPATENIHHANEEQRTPQDRTEQRTAHQAATPSLTVSEGATSESVSRPPAAAQSTADGHDQPAEVKSNKSQSEADKPAAATKKRSLFGFLSKFRRSSGRSSSALPQDQSTAAERSAAEEKEQPQHQPVASTAQQTRQATAATAEREADKANQDSDSDPDSDVQQPPRSLRHTTTVPPSSAFSVSALSASARPLSAHSSLAASRSSLARSALLSPNSQHGTAAAVRRPSTLSLTSATARSSSGGLSSLPPSLNAHSPLPSLTAAQPLALIGQRRPLQPTGRTAQMNRTTSSLTSRFLTDLGGDDGELSDEDDERAPAAAARSAGSAGISFAGASVYGSATSRIGASAVDRAPAVKSFTAPVSASVIADEEDEFDF